MADARTLTVTITGDTSKLSDSLRKATSDVSAFSSRAGSAASSFLGMAGSVATGIGIFEAVKGGLEALSGAFEDVIKAGVEDQKIQTQTAAVLKSTGSVAGETAQSVADLAKHFALITPFSNDAVQSTENLLLTFTNIGKRIFPQATEATLNMATALGEDTKSAAIQLGKALQDPVLGITALRRVGVNFSDAQKEVVKQLVATGQSAKAQDMILKELQTEFGGSAVAAGTTFAGAMAILGNQFDMLKESVGTTLITAVTPFIEKFNAWASSDAGQAKIKEITDKVEELTTKMVDWVQKVGLPWAKEHWPQIKKTVEELIPVLERLAPILGTIGKLVIQATPSYQATKAFIDVRTAVDMLKEAFEDLKQKSIVLFDTTQAKVVDFWNGVKLAFKNGVTDVIIFFDTLPSRIIYDVGFLIGETLRLFQQLPTNAENALKDLYTRVTSWFDRTKNDSTDKARSMVNDTESHVKTLPDKVRAALSDFWSNAKSAFDDFKTKALKWVDDTINSIANAFTSLPQKVSDAFHKGLSSAGNILSDIGKSFSAGFTAGYGGPKAAGGGVSSNTPYMVGENGPELFVPSTSGSIRPNSGTTNNSSISININGPIQMANDYSVDQFAKRLGAQLQLARLGV